MNDIKRPELWQILLEMDTPKHLIYLTQEPYVNNEKHMKLEIEKSSKFQPKKAVYQDCCISPILFRIYG